MKNMILTLMVLAQLSQAHAKDIFGQGDRFIKVTEYTTNGKTRDYVGFELCYKAHTNVCERIGKNKYYAKADLNDLRNSEKADVVLAALADVGILAVGLYGGALVGAAGTAAIGVESGAMLGVSAGAIGGTTGSVISITKFDAINPVEQYRQVDILSQDVINDRKVTKDRNILKVAHTLRTVLSNLE